MELDCIGSWSMPFHLLKNEYIKFCLTVAKSNECNILKD